MAINILFSRRLKDVISELFSGCITKLSDGASVTLFLNGDINIILLEEWYLKIDPINIDYLLNDLLQSIVADYKLFIDSIKIIEAGFCLFSVIVIYIGSTELTPYLPELDIFNIRLSSAYTLYLLAFALLVRNIRTHIIFAIFKLLYVLRNFYIVIKDIIHG